MTKILNISKLLGGYGTTERLGWLSVWTPTVVQVRHRTKPSLKNPTKFFAKLRLQAVAKPIYPAKLDACENELKLGTKTQDGIKDNKYALFLARCMRENFYKHPMIVVFHSNSFTGNELLHAKGLLYDNNFDMKLHHHRENREVALEALTNTKFEPVLPLIVSRTSLGFCSDTNVAKLLFCLKKMPQYLLIGLVLENRLLHRADIEAIANIPSITSLHAQLCHTLQLSSVQLSQTLTSNQNNLCASLHSLSNQSPSVPGDENAEPTGS